jgi:Tol biopolymer transport system component
VSGIDGSNAIRLTSSPSQLPVWTHDGAHVLFAGSIPGVGRGIIKVPSTGVGAPELILKGTAFPKAVSADGRFLFYVKRGVKTRADIWVLPLAEPGKPYPLVETPFEEFSPKLSADGRWLAYVSDESDTREVYVQSFTSNGRLGTDKRRVSANGAASPAWRRDGTELFFIAGDGQLTSVGLTRKDGDLAIGPPRALFHTRTLNIFGVYSEFDVTPDGKRFLVGSAIGDATSPPPIVTLNWNAGLQSPR